MVSGAEHRNKIRHAIKRIAEVAKLLADEIDALNTEIEEVLKEEDEYGSDTGDI